jgi:CO/xanthine dehydrogenase FAD-binding subunit
MGITIRNLATIGGSVMGKFAFSDLLGALLVLDCKLEFYMLGEVSIYDFMEMKKIPNDILLNIKIGKTQCKGYFKKVSKTHLDFSILNVAITKGDVYKIAIGSRPLAPDLAINTANFLNSQVQVDEEIIKQALVIALEEVKLSSNLRAQEDYRRVLMSTYLKRGIREVSK